MVSDSRVARDRVTLADIAAAAGPAAAAGESGPADYPRPWDFRHYHGSSRPASVTLAGFFPCMEVPHGYQAP